MRKYKKSYLTDFEKMNLKFFKLKFIFFKFKILQKRKKGLAIFSQGIFPPILKKIQTLVAELQVLTDRLTDRRRATAIGPVDLITVHRFVRISAEFIFHRDQSYIYDNI